MKTLLIFSCCLTLLISESIAQKKFLAISKERNVVHSLKISENLRVTELNKKSQRLIITDVSNAGLLTPQRLIPFTEIESITAKRHRLGGKQILGALVTISGMALLTGAGVLIADGWAGPAMVYLSAGILVTAGGITLASSSRKYSSDQWYYRVLPAELGTVPVDPTPKP